LSLSVVDKEEKLQRALSKQKEVMLAKILEVEANRQEADELKVKERRHESAISHARNEAKELIRLSSAKREARRSRIVEKAEQLKSKEKQVWSAWKQAQRKRADEAMNQTFSEGIDTQRSVIQTAQRQRQSEAKALKLQEFEQQVVDARLKQFEEKMHRHHGLHKVAVTSITKQIAAKVQKVNRINKAIEALRETDTAKKAWHLIKKL
jgi:hypothetical protein